MKRQQKSFIQGLTSIIAIVVCLLLAPLLIMNLTIVVKSYFNPNKVPDFFGIKPLVVVTGSMEPTISGGDLVITKTVDPTVLKERDIISFKEGNAVITHRIVELTKKDGEPVFITQGDANNVKDNNPIAYSQVEGICLFKIKQLGNLALFMQTPIGMLVFVGIPLCSFVIYDIVRRRLADQKARTRSSDEQAEIERLKAQLAQRERLNKDETNDQAE